MKALLFLVITNVKNSIIEFKKHPAKLILVAFFIIIFAITIIGGNTNTQEAIKLGKLEELYAGAFLLFAITFIINIMTGFSSGASFFSMSDVNLLFLTPISTKKILYYGLIKQMTQSFLIGFFILFQYSWLHVRYGISVWGLFAILVGFSLIIFCSQLTSMLIYSFTNNNEKLKKLLKTGIIAVCLIIVVLLAKDVLLTTENKLEAAINSVNSTWVSFLPVIGWVKVIMTCMISNNLIPLIIALAAIIIYIMVFTTIIAKYNVDFYEDVLQATEVTHSAITAKKEGKLSEITKNVKLGKTGINKGCGANVFFYKHMLENRRTGGLLIDKTSIIFMATTIFFALVFNGIDSDSSKLIAIFAFSTYMQIFSVATGRWVKELILPYIYMIPESAFKKLINVVKESILKIIIEAIILFIVIGIILKAPVLEILFCIIARIGFGILFIAGSVLIERILGSLTSKTLTTILYFVIMIFIAIPGFVVGALLTYVIKVIPELILILGTTFVWNVLTSSLIIYLCKDILNYAELNNR